MCESVLSICIIFYFTIQSWKFKPVNHYSKYACFFLIKLKTCLLSSIITNHHFLKRMGLLDSISQDSVEEPHCMKMSDCSAGESMGSSSAKQVPVVPEGVWGCRGQQVLGEGRLPIDMDWGRPPCWVEVLKQVRMPCGGASARLPAAEGSDQTLLTLKWCNAASWLKQTVWCMVTSSSSGSVSLSATCNQRMQWLQQ